MKPIKRGIKVWCRADSHSGYLCDFDIYTGRHRDGIQRGLGYSVVTRLCRGIEGKWYNVYFDNFFTSYPLLEDLYSKKILACGTVRQGRKEFPAVLFDKNAIKTMKRGETVWRMKGPILALRWIDNKPVTISGTTTGIPEEKLAEVERRKKDGTLENVTCPPLFQPTTSTWVERNGGQEFSFTSLTGQYSMEKYCSMNAPTLQEKA